MATWPAKINYATGDVLTAAQMNDIGGELNNLYTASGAAAAKNVVINGGYDIWQRSTSSSSVNGYYTADRWYNGGGGTVTISQSTDVPTDVSVQYSQKWLTGASSSYGQYYYALEQAIVKPLRSQAMVLSYYIKTAGSHTGNINTSISYSNSTDTLVSVTTSVTATGDTAYTASSVTSWTRKYIYFTVPSDAVGLRFSIIPDIAQASGVSEFLTGVQLELGSTATPFSRNGATIQGELAACQRYYYQHATGNTQPICLTTNYSSTLSIGWIELPVTMRIAPTIAVTSGTNYYSIDVNGGALNFSAPTIGAASTTSVRLDASVTGATGGQAGYSRTNNASSSIGFISEL